jgi:hypothetical protein
MNTRRRLLAGGLGVALGLAAWGCRGGDDGGAAAAAADVPELSVVAKETGGGSGAHEYTFELPDRVEAGAARISLTNEGAEEHHAQLFKLNEGATVDDLVDALVTGDPTAPLAVGTFDGGTGVVAADAASQAEAIVDLTPGTYAFLCFLEDRAGQPHLAHGMLQPFEVTDGEQHVPVPQADVEVDLVDYGFSLPESIPGDAVLEITNQAEVEPHEMMVARLDDGATREDVLDALAAGQAPPATAVGGMQALLPGASQSLRLDLEPGDYVVACHIPSLHDQEPHYDKGMIQQVTVT